MAATSQRLGLPALTALVVGSMVGAGIFRCRRTSRAVPVRPPR